MSHGLAAMEHGPDADGRKPRNAILAGLLSLLFPGAGQFYNGRPVKAMAFWLGGYVLLAGIALANLQYCIQGLIIQGLAAAAWRIWVVLDAGREARRLGSVRIGGWKRWQVYVLFMMATAGIGALTDPLLEDHVYRMRMVHVRTLAMAPAVQRGDNLLVDTRRSTQKGLAVGDIVAVADQDNPLQLRPRRVAGLPGQVVPGGAAEGFPDPVVLGMDQYFLVTDDPGVAGPPSVGPVALGRIKGKALFVYWSLDTDRIGVLLD